MNIKKNNCYKLENVGPAEADGAMGNLSQVLKVSNSMVVYYNMTTECLGFEHTHSFEKSWTEIHPLKKFLTNKDVKFVLDENEIIINDAIELGLHKYNMKYKDGVDWEEYKYFKDTESDQYLQLIDEKDDSYCFINITRTNEEFEETHQVMTSMIRKDHVGLVEVTEKEVDEIYDHIGFKHTVVADAREQFKNMGSMEDTLNNMLGGKIF